MDETNATTGTAGNGVAHLSCAGCGQGLADDARFCPYCGMARATGPTPIVDLSDVDIVAAVTASDPAVVSEQDAVDEIEVVEPAATEDGERDTDILAVTEDPSEATPIDGEATGSTTPDENFVAEAPTGRTRRRLLVLAAVAAIAIGGAVAAVLLSGGGPGYDLDTTLTVASDRTADVLTDADRATTLAQLRDAGDAAEDATEDLTALRRELVEVSNVDDRRAAEQAFDARLAALEAVAALAGLDATKVAEWPDVDEELADTVSDLEAAEAALAERGLASTPDLADGAAGAADRLDVVLAGIVEKLDGWAAEVGRIDADKSAQSKALNDYVVAFRSQIERYAQLRVSLGEMTERLLNEGGTYSSAYADLGGAVAQRRETHVAMSALVPPAPLVPAHTAIVAAVRDSIAAVESAVQGLEQYQYDWYYTIDMTPGWQAFSRTSRQISETYTGAVGSWDAAVAAEEARISAITTPKRPAV